MLRLRRRSMMYWALAISLGAGCGAAIPQTPVAARSAKAASQMPVARGGEARWFKVPGGRLKGRVYSTAVLSAHPLLLVVLHGDLPKPPPSYHYDFAQAATEGFDAVSALPAAARPAFGPGPDLPDLVAAALTRPGYTDAAGDRSDGSMGYGIADNYTPEVVDDVAGAIQQLQSQYRPRATIVVGHSGGASIMANLLGRHPGLANAALLAACGCDPVDRRARWKAESPDPVFDQPNPSLLPLDLAALVPRSTVVRLLVGAMDRNSLPAYSEHYASALRAHGVDATVTTAPGQGHDILFSPPAFAALSVLLKRY